MALHELVVSGRERNCLSLSVPVNKFIDSGNAVVGLGCEECIEGYKPADLFLLVTLVTPFINM